MFDPTIIFVIVILIFSVIIHELAHGYVAFFLGDPTAKYAGRLTLNPLKHIDIFGSIILPLLLVLSSLFSSGPGIILGWAKPVPINPYNFKDQKWGALKVAVAGPCSNIVLALLFGMIIRFTPHEFILMYPGFFRMMGYIVIINLMLAIFNLLPIPPLDGHWILFNFLPERFSGIKNFLQQYGIFILLLLIFFNGLYFLGILHNLIAYSIVGNNWVTIINLLTPL